MNLATNTSNLAVSSGYVEQPERVPAFGDTPMVFTDIFQQEVNIAIWQRELDDKLQVALQQYLNQSHSFSVAKVLKPDNVMEELELVMDDFEFGIQIKEMIAELVDMFACLFDLPRVGVRLAVLDKAMCPRFHVDKIPCRLVTTFCGTGTQWLSNQNVNRNKLATGDSDETSGVIGDSTQVNTLTSGEVVLLKGETWQDNEGGGIVHRSPSASPLDKRLVLTLDFV